MGLVEIVDSTARIAHTRGRFEQTPAAMGRIGTDSLPGKRKAARILYGKRAV